jgi:small subunit ribosomal protein S6
MNRYELGIVAKPDLSEAELNALVEKMKGVIVQQGGEVEAIDLWGKRRLAYPVEKHNEGYYVFFRFLLSPARVEEIGRVARLTEEVLRYILVKEEKKEPVTEKETPLVEEKETPEPPVGEVIGDASVQSE